MLVPRASEADPRTVFTALAQPVLGMLAGRPHSAAGDASTNPGQHPGQDPVTTPMPNPGPVGTRAVDSDSGVPACSGQLQPELLAEVGLSPPVTEPCSLAPNLSINPSNPIVFCDTGQEIAPKQLMTAQGCCLGHQGVAAFQP